MKLRSTLYAVAAVMTVGMMGCGEQPRYYRVSIDRSPLGSMPSSCYSSGTAPTPNDRTSNVVDVAQWVLWDGVEGQQYLAVGDINYSLGDARVDIDVSDAIVSVEKADKPTFTVERTQTGPNRVSRATYTLNKVGDTLEGTIALSYECSGSTGCAPNCNASLNFVGRRLSAEPMVLVGSDAAR
ncbi:MAG TPA: hypothetical protein VFZ09_22540 [Archangium sp.]|uniref:hypothetical protein n=1 Tax=Archangium sp. TaxID=1872627 RepID=UPI002E34FDB7|nr:hypothetical protein [Archangium sp.]HEX5749037.1 hypothetical protein [Archangium sp.]